MNPDDPPPSPSSWPPRQLPVIFTDPGYGLLGTSIISTSNCGNPALRLFGFGPVAADGYGIGYIIKDDGISMCVQLSRVSLNCEHRLTLRTAVRRLNTCRPGASSTRSKATFTTYSGSLCTYTVQQMHAPNLLSITPARYAMHAREGRLTDILPTTMQVILRTRKP